jgi:hypothetical protein
MYTMPEGSSSHRTRHAVENKGEKKLPPDPESKGVAEEYNHPYPVDAHRVLPDL